MAVRIAKKKGGNGMKKRIFSLLVLVLALVLLLGSCGMENGGYTSDSAPAPDYGNGGATSTDTVISDTRKIIKTVNESVETEHYDDLITGLKAAVDETGGYFANSRYTGGGTEDIGTRTAHFEIRIPAERLADFTGKLGTLGTVTEYYETANDVTMSYLDIESRISVLEAEETALTAMLADAKTTSEMLAIRESLSRVQSDLASLRAQKMSYDTLVAYSTVHLSVEEVAAEHPADESFFGEVGTIFGASLSAVGAFFRGIGIIILGGAPLWILFLGIALGTFFLIRFFIRRTSGKTEKKDPNDHTKNGS